MRWAPALACMLGACGDAAPAPVFVEVAADRVPAIQQRDPIAGHAFWGPGAGAGDIDGDGRLDVYLGGGGLYRNRADERGYRLEDAVLPAIPFEVLSAVFADYDGDGDQDLSVCGNGGVRLLANDGSGAFVDVTAGAGLDVLDGELCADLAWGDLDGDGALDLSVATYGEPTDRTPSSNHLLLNRRDGRFAELATPVADRANRRRSLTTAFADFDGDGRLDLYYGDDQLVLLEPGAPRGDLVFLGRGLDASGAPQLVESSAALGLDGFRATMGCGFGDVGRTGGPDLFVADIFRGWLFRRDDAGYRDVTAEAGIDQLRGPAAERWVHWGGAFVDLAGDGYEDLLVGQASVHFGDAGREVQGPLLLHNRGGQLELERYAFGEPMGARGTLLADLDGDGDDDVIVVPYFSAYRYFDNQSPARDFVRLYLRGTVSGGNAAGAMVTASHAGSVQRRMVVSGCRPFASAPPVVDLAEPGADALDLIISWPSGATRTLTVATGTVMTVTEPAWLEVTDRRPPADGATTVTVTLDLTAAGLGDDGSVVTWTSPGLEIDASVAPGGLATLVLPPRGQPGAVRGTITVDGRVLPVHPALDYQ